MKNSELLDNLWSDIKQVSIPYEGHARIEQIFRAYHQQINGQEQKQEKPVKSDS